MFAEEGVDDLEGYFRCQYVVRTAFNTCCYSNASTTLQKESKAGWDVAGRGPSGSDLVQKVRSVGARVAVAATKYNWRILMRRSEVIQVQEIK